MSYDFSNLFFFKYYVYSRLLGDRGKVYIPATHKRYKVYVNKKSYSIGKRFTPSEMLRTR